MDSEAPAVEPQPQHDEARIRHASPRDFEDELSSSQQLQALDLQLPTTPALSVASLRDAILGYLQEAELIVKERLLQTNQAEANPSEAGAPEWHQDAAAAGGETGASWSSSIGDHHTGEGSYSGLNLRKRSQALRRRFSTGTGSILPATFSTSPEALLAHLSAIRADVLASMPTVHLPSISVPAIPSRPSFTRLASLRNASAEGSLPNMMAGFLSSLPARLSFIHEHLPNPPDLSQMSHAGMSLPKRPALGFTEEHKRRIMQIVHGMLPSEDWAGWEKLGWEDEDEYQARISQGRSGRSHQRSWSSGSPEGKSFLRELDGDALGLHHHFVRKRPLRRRTVSEGAIGLPNDEEDDEADEDDLEEEVQEEPEYLFPNKTPRAALSRHQSYMVAQEAFEREKQARRRSVSVSSSKSRRSAFGLEESDDEDEDEQILPTAKVRTHPQPVGPSEAAVTMPPIAATSSVVIDGLRKSQNGKKLIGYEDLPPWMQNNEYIVTGYRFIPLDAKSGPIPLILSLFGWHNETINIHSHLLPTVVLLAFAIPYTLLHSPIANPAPLDILTLLAFMLAAASCLISSAGWHLLSGCSRRGLFEWGACVDYVGISWLISCSIHTVYYNGFYCQGRTLFIYSMATLASATAGSIAPFQPFFNKRENKPWRILFFLGICFTALAPLTHLALQHGANKMLHFAGPILTSCAAYVFGLMFYATHFPERRWPGKFDFVGHSHQIWHLSIVLAIFLHYRGCIHIFEHREALSCALPDAGPPMSTYLRGYSKYFLGMDHLGQA